jgi:hypothetical protein
MVLAVVTGVVLSRRSQRSLGLSRGERLGIGLGAFCGAMIGAKLPIKLYIITYLGYRFLTEFIRPEPTFASGLTGYQWAALVLIPVFVALWIRDRRTLNSAEC